MTDVLTHSVLYARSVQVRQYEMKKIELTREFTTPANATEAEFDVAAAGAILQAESLVLAALDIDGLSDGGAVAPRSEGDQPAPAPAGRAVLGDWPKPTFTSTKGKSAGKEIATNEFKEWARERFKTHPSEFFDDTDSDNPKVKHKATGVNVWLS
jgi:hypothetical protein